MVTLFHNYFKKGRVPKIKKRKSMVFDHTPTTPPSANLNYALLIQNFVELFFSHCFGFWILVRKQTQENIFGGNFQTPKLFLSPYLSLFLQIPPIFYHASM